MERLTKVGLYRCGADAGCESVVTQLSNHAVAVTGGSYVAPYMFDRARGTDHECGADETLVLSTVVLLDPPRAKGRCDGVVLVGEEREAEIVFGMKSLELFDGIRADTDDRTSGISKVASSIAQVARLGRTSRCGRPGIEVDQ